MVAVFDTWPVLEFPTELLNWKPVGMPVTGPGSFTGPGQVGEFSGGGWWTANLTGIDLADAPEIRHFRALLGRAGFGTRRFIVRMIDDPLVALPEPVPFDDDAPFDDDSEFEGGAVAASVTAAAALRATSLQIVCDVELKGGEVFTIVHAIHGPRIYLLTAVTALGEGAYSVKIVPPLREAVAADEVCDFDRPRCVMRIDDPNGEAWPTIQPGWQAKANIRFVEAFDQLDAV